MTGVIYKIQTPNNNIYIGQALDFKRRKNQHVYNATHAESNEFEYPCSRAIRKHGDNLDWKIIIYDILEEDLDEMETMMIAHYNSYKKGLNQTPGKMKPYTCAKTDSDYKEIPIGHNINNYAPPIKEDPVERENRLKVFDDIIELCNFTELQKNILIPFIECIPQTQIAKQLNISDAAVSQALWGKYGTKNKKIGGIVQKMRKVALKNGLILP